MACAAFRASRLILEAAPYLRKSLRLLLAPVVSDMLSCIICMSLSGTISLAS